MRRPLLLTGLAALTAAMSACTGATAPVASPPPKAYPAPALRLVAYDSCDSLVGDLRKAAKANVHAWGFGDMQWLDFASARGGAVPQAADTGKAAGGAAGAYSGTNSQETGVDEPDLVKTDGRRIVTIVQQRLTIVDAAQHKISGSLTMPGPADQLLLNGDHALVIGQQWKPVKDYVGDDMGGRFAGPASVSTMVWLVDLSAQPTIVSSYKIDAGYADARQTGSVARIVVRSTPAIVFPRDARGTEKTLIKANQKTIDKAPVSAWLPAYETDGRKGAVECGDVSLPDAYSGTSMVTVLSFDLARDVLGSGVPTAVVADGNTVYGSGTSLYVAHDQRWRGVGVQPSTELFQFDTTAMQPRYVAGGTVPGWLLNQYALSEYDGVLRVATTSAERGDPAAKPTSAVYALRPADGNLKIVGQVGGLGQGEQIYAVRYAGPVAYVVTFRRTDPLYAIDMTDPAHPRVAGELKIPGYSAYLHPIGGGQLIGVGQNADDNGRVAGTQVSLFDTSDLSDPKRLANLTLASGSSSEAEWDAHAFLYWPDTKLVVVPVTTWDKTGNGMPHMGVSLIHLDGTKLTDIGWVSHPAVGNSGPKGQVPAAVRRSLVIGDELWTVSDAGVMASRLNSGDRVAWLPVD